MNVGFSLPIFGQAANRDDLRRMVALADECEFESVWAADHLMMPKQITTRYEYTRGEKYPADPGANHFDIFTSLAAAAALSESVKIGSNVLIAPYRHPIETAKMLACLDVISGGRTLIGIGIGWMKEEFVALDVPYSERGARTDEIIQIWKSLWQQGEASFEGHFYRPIAVQSYPRPLQRPHPPLLVGGYTMAALRRAVLHGTDWMVIVEGPVDCYGPSGNLAQDIAVLRDLSRTFGRDPGTVGVTGMLFAGPRSTVRHFLDDYEAYESAGVDRMIVTFPALKGDVREMEHDLREIAQSRLQLRAW